ncbi:hypothetical protein BDW59DRAFT_155093 [Aspergillus cavernicola]|uniref:BZIP domain-containing protein n=1 Tax=Aspergillus cavernicola TaxID=176166 RepID=A0ABR4HCG2_9EURO
MPRPKQKTKAEDLARVRNNQRRSRERKKQRVVELEQRVHQLEAAMIQAPAPGLVYENRVLRGLLESVGLDRVWLERYLQGDGLNRLPESVDSGPAVDSTAVPSSVTQFIGPEPGLSISSDITSYELNQVGLVSTTELSLSRAIPGRFDSLGSDFSHPTQTVESMEMAPNMIQSQAVSDTGFNITEDLAGIILNLGGENLSATSSVNSETTLCSIAFQLIIQCNRTGKDVLDLETKLRYGYRMPAVPGDGCRVDNKSLLAVLAELV